MDYLMDRPFSRKDNHSLVLCPSCKSEIPFLMLKKSHTKIQVEIRCPQCSIADNYLPLSTFLNIINEQQSYSHSTNNLNGKCLRHNNPFAWYCNHTKANLCYSCIESAPQRYNLWRRIEPIDIKAIYAKNTALFMQKMEKTKEITCQFLKLIQRESSANRIEMTKEIDHAYRRNVKNNKALRALYQALYYTAWCIGFEPYFQLNHMFKSLEVNIGNYTFNPTQSIRKSYEGLRCYLETSFVMKLEEYKSITLIKQKTSASCLVQLSNDLVASEYKDSIRLWDIQSSKCITKIKIKNKAFKVSCLLQLSNGVLVSGSVDKVLQFWDVKSFKCIAILQGHKNAITCLLQLSKHVLASGGKDCRVKLWDIQTLQCLTRLNTYGSCPSCLMQLSNGLLAFGSYDRKIILWNIETGSCVTLEGHQQRVSCLLQLFNGLLASGSEDFSIKLWDIKSFKCITTFKGNSSVFSLIQLHNGVLASGTYDGTLEFWDIKTFKCVSIIEAHEDSVTCLIQLSNGLFASGSKDCKIKVWNKC